MKKNLFMVAAVVLMALTACNKEEVAGGNPADNQTPATVEFTASFADTKTTLNNEGKKTLWVEDDRIDINGQEFKIKELVNGGLSAIFENVNELPVGFAAPFTATYPYDVAEVPATQTAIAGTFDPAAVLETATSNDHNLSFTNVTSLLKFQVPAACQTVTISSTDVLAGSSAKTVTVNGPFAAGETYYAAVLPGTKANFVVRIDGYLSKNAASVTIAESTIANMQTLPAPVASEWVVKGNFDGWGAGLALYNDLNGNVVAKNANLNGAFKVVRGSKYIRSINNSPTLSKWHSLYDANGDMTMTGTYDIYVNTNNKAICVVNVGNSVPSYEIANKEIYMSVQSSWGWEYLYGYNESVSPKIEVWGEWQTDKPTFTQTISSTGYFCWKVPSEHNGITVTLISSKKGEQSPNKDNVKLDKDRFFELVWDGSTKFNEVTAPSF